MTVVVNDNNKGYVYVKGSPEKLMKISNNDTLPKNIK